LQNSVKFNELTEAYIECALKHSLEHKGVDLSREFDVDDIEEPTLEFIKQLCADFETQFLEIYEEVRGPIRSHQLGWRLSQAGRAFWFSSSSNQAFRGFGDLATWERELGNRLTKLAHESGPGIRLYRTENDTLAMQENVDF
jgi:hypothetical protein